MYFHPLQEEIGNMSDEDISKRIRTQSEKGVLRLGTKIIRS